MLNIVNEFDNNFEDVPVGSYYYNAIGSAKACGIATGDGVNFMPESTITRQDLITLAYRAFSSVGYIQESDASVLDTFGDKASIAPYAAGAMASMVNAGIIKGSDGNVNPLGNATRAEVAVMCARLAALIK
ncbi:MAG: S-layer homology domain-containing protein [Clostridia bacterium]|nr:S-layer homology domain-containing protein [Clostridia bacterium]